MGRAHAGMVALVGWEQFEEWAKKDVAGTKSQISDLDENHDDTEGLKEVLLKLIIIIKANSAKLRAQLAPSPSPQ